MLDRNWRIQHHRSFSHEHRTRYLSLHRRYKTHGAGLKMEGGRVSFEFEVINGNCLTAQPDVAQLLIDGVRVWANRGRRLRKRSKRDERHDREGANHVRN